MSEPRPRVAAIIPVLDEEAAVGPVIRAIPRDLVDAVVAVDGGSSDRTVEMARAAGATVVETGRGYGRACAEGARAATARGAEILLFLDGDGGDRPEAIPALLAPLFEGRADFVIAARTGDSDLGVHQKLAGRLAGFLIGRLWGVFYTDMCAFRAIGAESLRRLGMRETTYGWNLEMQMRAARAGLRVLELPLPAGRRLAGRSKVAGTVTGSLKAGLRIAATFLRILCERKTAAPP
ncbi:MAG TPA: glycosyltransferase family 2 protein [Stellaceae bacterium]|nr:glycosyltransferase family 2 protein [Stellaceae bacterium]